MNNNNDNFDNKENLGHGIKGEINTTANRLRNDRNNTNNKTTSNKNKNNDNI